MNDRSGNDLQPRRPKGGIRFDRGEAALLVDRRSAGWVHHLSRLCDQTARATGLEYARSGHVLSLGVEPGRITAEVQGARRRPNRVVIAVQKWSDDQWRRAIDLLAANAALAADALTGHLPESAVRGFADAGLSLVPGEGEISIETDLPESLAGSFKAASFYVLSQHLLEMPLDLLVLRGFRTDTLAERIRQRRAIEVQGVLAAHTTAITDAIAAEEHQFDDRLDDFWDPVSSSDVIEPASARHAPHALLRRLGPSPLKGRFPIVGLLASVYDEVAAAIDRDSQR